MAIISLGQKQRKDLSVNIKTISSDDGDKNKPMVKKRAYRKRKIAKGHIYHRDRGKNRFYYYRRGTDPEIYLGDADTILEKVKGKKTQ